jgi:hypothetical protein
MGGDAWVLPVGQLSEAEEASVREQVNSERQGEYQEVAGEAANLVARSGRQPPTKRELNALQRRLERIGGRDHYGAAGRTEAVAAVEDLARHSARQAEVAALARC